MEKRWPGAVLSRRLIAINDAIHEHKNDEREREVISAEPFDIENVRASRMRVRIRPRPVAISGVRVYGLTWAIFLRQEPSAGEAVDHARRHDDIEYDAIHGRRELRLR